MLAFKISIYIITKLTKVIDDVTAKAIFVTSPVCLFRVKKVPISLLSMGMAQLCAAIEQRDKTYLFCLADETMDQRKSRGSCFKLQ